MNKDIKKKLEYLTGNSKLSDDELQEALKEVLDDMQSDELQDVPAKESVSIGELVSKNIDWSTSGTHESNLIKTGFKSFDANFGGFIPGEFVVIGGRPGMGKTQLLVNLALNISLQEPVLYFIFDQLASNLSWRFLASISGISADRIKNNQLTEQQRESLAESGKEMMSRKIFVNDANNKSIAGLIAECIQQIKANGVRVIMIDYLQLLSSGKKHHHRDYELSYIIRQLKNLAVEHGVCVIAASQLNRSVEMRGGLRKPYLYDLRDSGAIEQEADKVILIYRPEYYGLDCDEEGYNSEGLMELNIAKNRNGRLGTVKLLRDVNFTTYRDFDHDNYAFSFSQSRLDEIMAKNPNTKTLIDKFGVDEPPF
jgi:replicative DNA helicase